MTIGRIHVGTPTSDSWLLKKINPSLEDVQLGPSTCEFETQYHHNDIAIVEVDEAFNFTAYVQPIAIKANDSELQEQYWTTIIGFGPVGRLDLEIPKESDFVSSKLNCLIPVSSTTLFGILLVVPILREAYPWPPINQAFIRGLESYCASDTDAVKNLWQNALASLRDVTFTDNFEPLTGFMSY
uniref:Peptidase S1 domain-containing protein n=1 Tax=Steinernema glaseri TaxID=37863 RepID=A0A1I8AKG9_9BILA